MPLQRSWCPSIFISLQVWSDTLEVGTHDDKTKVGKDMQDTKIYSLMPPVSVQVAEKPHRRLITPLDAIVR